MDISNIDLFSLQTQAMKADPTTQALCQILNSYLAQAAEDAGLVVILQRVDSLPEAVLDELAVQLHIEWYDATAPIAVKRALIKSSRIVHSLLGTPFAVEQVVKDYFGDGKVEEWFEYGGDPGYFRVLTANSAVTGDQATRFALAVEGVKNKRSVLEAVIITLMAELQFYRGCVLHTGDTITIRQVG